MRRAGARCMCVHVRGTEMKPNLQRTAFRFFKVSVNIVFMLGIVDSSIWLENIYMYRHVTSIACKIV